MRLLLVSLFLFFTLNSFAYEHSIDPPPDFDLRKAFYDKDLTRKYTVGYGKEYLKNLQIVGYSHRELGGPFHFTPTSEVYAYDYFASYVNSRGDIRHIWESNILQDNNGKHIKSFITVPSNYKILPIYQGKTYTKWTDWYKDKFYTDLELFNKYRDVSNLEIYTHHKIEQTDPNTAAFIGYKYIPMYKFTYFGSFKQGGKTYHAWRTYLTPSIASEALIYTTKPEPPKDFKNREALARKSYFLF